MLCMVCVVCWIGLIIVVSVGMEVCFLIVKIVGWFIIVVLLICLFCEVMVMFVRNGVFIFLVRMNDKMEIGVLSVVILRCSGWVMIELGCFSIF